MMNCSCTGCLAFILAFLALTFLLKLGAVILFLLIGLIIITFIMKNFEELFEQLISALKSVFEKKEKFVSKPGIIYKECKYCGKKAERTAKFCPDCGKPFEDI